MTRKLFHENQYLQNFSSVIVENFEYRGVPAVVLEQTAFYPTSGGQPHDLGTLDDVPVVDVIEDEAGRIIHLLERPIRGQRVHGQIDWKRRFDHTQQHTGQHLLSQVFLRLCDAETTSFHLGADSASIDVNQAELDADTVEFVEALTNQILYENRDVIIHHVAQDELSRFPIRKLPTVEGVIRLVEIKDFDYSPCCGTHCASTGEIGMIKITKVENYKGGSRVYFLCGSRALKDYQQKGRIIQQLSETMSSGEADLPAHLGKLQDELKTLRKERQQLAQQLLEAEARALLPERETIGKMFVLKKRFEQRPPKELRALASMIAEQAPQTVVLFGDSYEGKASLVFARSNDLSIHVGELMKQACATLDGRGGGQPHLAEGGGAAVEKLDEALQSGLNSLKEIKTWE
ncbi:alanyl-tRNA synthetase, truncated [Candidatus Moduliflexus flocculans]|uniref:Alanine--tRNA ligase n=1 Tax=Candidatus Moduliflexus flocculans TaxID=1499966 RepID=A0A081BMI4_9BACT|nr:alanyl-tRNA synthetase, truncated [Candidatus Moduliflexus flocculans]